MITTEDTYHEVFRRLDDLYFATNRGLTPEQGQIEFTTWAINQSEPAMLLALRLAQVIAPKIMRREEVRHKLDSLFREIVDACDHD